uniref:StAR-related lipid transfer protein 9 n=2 Tax=Leptobrachium leishanense TaxID=445787 RepID=A0A8C5N192_9ANUR
MDQCIRTHCAIISQFVAGVGNEKDANVKLIRNLREEINRLKLMLRSFEMRTSSPSLSEEKEGNLTELVLENELKIEKLTKDWTDKWTDEANIMDQYKVDINQGKAGFSIDPNLPHLIAMDDDILSTGVVIYHLREGTTEVGRGDSNRDQDIVLNGEWMEKEHCMIVNHNGVVELRPVSGALCTVNGKEVKDACRLSQGVVIVLGNTHRFRFNHPAEAAILRQQRSDSQASFFSSGSLDWLDLSGTFSTLSDGNHLSLNSRDTDPLNKEYEQKLSNLEAVYQQQVEEQQQYVQDLKKQIHAAQAKGEQELAQEQSLINQQIQENQQWLVREEQRWTTVHQQRQETAVQTDPKTYAEAEVQNSVQTEDIQPSIAEQDRKRLVHLELLRKCSLRRAERNIKRKRVRYQLEWIAKKQKLLEAKKNLQQLQAVCWVNEDTIKQIYPPSPSAQESAEICTLKRSTSSPPGLTCHRRGSLPWSLPRLPSYSSLLKRKSKSDGKKNNKTFEEGKPRRFLSVECLSKTICNCSKNELLTTKPKNTSKTTTLLPQKHTSVATGSLYRKAGSCGCATILISNPQMSKKRPKMDKVGNGTKKVPHNRLAESEKTRSTRAPVNHATRDAKSKSLKTATQRPSVTLKNSCVQEKRKTLQKNEGTKVNTEKSPKSTKPVSSLPRPVTRHSPPTDKMVKHLKDANLQYNQKLSADGDEKVRSSVDNINQLSTSATIDKKWKSTEILKSTTDLKERWTEDVESASSDSESFYSVDSLSSAYASALNKQLKMEELEENKLVADHKNSDSEDSQMSQDSLIEKENQKQKPNKRRFQKYKTTVKTPSSYDSSSSRSQDPTSVVVAGSVASGLSRGFSLDSLADADEMCEADSTDEFPAEIFWKLQSPRFSTQQTQNQSQVDTTEESNDSTVEFNRSFFLNVNPPFFDKMDLPFDKSRETCLTISANDCDACSEPLAGSSHIMGARSSRGSQSQDCGLEAVEPHVDEVFKFVQPSLPSVPIRLSKDKDLKSISAADTFLAHDLRQSPQSPLLATTQLFQDVKTHRVKTDQGSVETLKHQCLEVQLQNPQLERKATEKAACKNVGHVCDISIASSNRDLNNSDKKFQCTKGQTSECSHDGNCKNDQAEPKKDNEYTDDNDFQQLQCINCNGEEIQEVVKTRCRNSPEDIENLARPLETQVVRKENICVSPEICEEKTENVFLTVCKAPVPSPLIFDSVNVNKPKSTILLATEKPLVQSVCHGLTHETPADVTVLDQGEQSEKVALLVRPENHEPCHHIANATEQIFDQNENLARTKLLYGFEVNMNYSVESCSGSSQSGFAKPESQDCETTSEILPELVIQPCNKVETSGSKSSLNFPVPCDQTFPTQPSISTMNPEKSDQRECKENAHKMYCSTEKETGLDNGLPIQISDKLNEILTATNSDVRAISGSQVHVFSKPPPLMEDKTIWLHSELGDKICDSLQMDRNLLSEVKRPVTHSFQECHSDALTCECCEKKDLIPEQATEESGGGTCDELKGRLHLYRLAKSQKKPLVENSDKNHAISNNANFNHNDQCNKSINSAIPQKTVDSNCNPEGHPCSLEVEMQEDKTEETTIISTTCLLPPWNTTTSLHPDIVYIEGKHDVNGNFGKNLCKLYRQTDAEGTNMTSFTNERKEVTSKEPCMPEDSHKTTLTTSNLQKEATSKSIHNVNDVEGADTTLAFLGAEELNSDNGKLRSKCTGFPDKMPVSICTKNKDPPLGLEPEAESPETPCLDQAKHLYMESRLNLPSLNITHKRNINGIISTNSGDQSESLHGSHITTPIDGSFRYPILCNDKKSNGCHSNSVTDLKNLNLENPKSVHEADSQPLISGDDGKLYSLLHHPENIGNPIEIVSVPPNDHRSGISTYSSYKLKNEGDDTTAAGHVDSSKLNENVYFGINVTSGSLPGNNECSDLRRLQEVSGTNLVLPYYEAILQQEICIEGKNSKGRIFGICTKDMDFSMDEHDLQKGNQTNLQIEMPKTNLTNTNKPKVCCSTNYDFDNTNHPTFLTSELIMKKVIGPLSSTESEPNRLHKINFSNGHPGISENSQISAEGSTCEASLSQEGFPILNTSEKSQNGQKTVISKKPEELGVESHRLYTSSLDDHSQPNITHKFPAEDSHAANKLGDEQHVPGQKHECLAAGEDLKVGEKENKEKPAYLLQDCGNPYSSDMACSMLHATAAPLSEDSCIFPNKHDNMISEEINKIAPESSCVNTYPKNLVMSNPENIALASSISLGGTSSGSSQSTVCEDVGPFTLFSHTNNNPGPIVTNWYDKVERKLNDLLEKDAFLLEPVLGHACILDKDEPIGVEKIKTSSDPAKHERNDQTEGDSIHNVSCEQYISDENVAANTCTQTFSFSESNNRLPVGNKLLKTGYTENDGDLSNVLDCSSNGSRNLIMPMETGVPKDHQTNFKVECRLPEQQSDYSLSPSLIARTNTTNTEPGQSPFFVCAESIKTNHMKSLPHPSGSTFDIVRPITKQIEGANNISSNPSVPCIISDDRTGVQHANTFKGQSMGPFDRPRSATISENVLSDKTLYANEYFRNEPKKMDSDGIQEFSHHSLNALADNKDGLHFPSSDINPFVHTWHSAENGIISWKPSAFNSATDVSSTRDPASLENKKVMRCSSVDEGLNTHNLPFHSHLRSYANARIMSSTLSSIEDQFAVRELKQEFNKSSCSLDGSLYDYAPTGKVDLIKQDSEPHFNDHYTLTSKHENDSEQVDEIVLLYTSESETCDENDLGLSWELGTQTRGRHRRLNQHQRSHTDVTSVKPNGRNQYQRPATWSSVQDMSMHLSQLLHETSELLGNLSQHQSENFHIDIGNLRSAAAGKCVKRTLQDSFTQTTVDIGVQTDPKVDNESKDRVSDKQGKEHNGLLNAPEINVIVKVIGTESTIQSLQNSPMAARQNDVSKAQSLPDLQDLPSPGQSERRLCHSANGGASTTFLVSSQEGTIETTSSPISTGSHTSTTVVGKPGNLSYSGSSTTQKEIYNSRLVSHIRKSHKKSAGQDDSMMVDRATSPILTRKASKKPLEKLFQEKDFTSQNIVKLLRHRRKRDRSANKPPLDNSSQTETDSECGSFQGSFKILSKSEHRNRFSLGESTNKRISEGSKQVHRFGSEDCIPTGVQPVVFTRSRSISEVSGVGKLSYNMNYFSLGRCDKADGTSATTLNSQYNMTSAPWERPQSLENLSQVSEHVKNKTIQTLSNVGHGEHCNDYLNHALKDRCNDDLECADFTAKSNSLMKNTSYQFSEISDLNLQEDTKSVAESECNTDILLNLDSYNRLSQKAMNYSLQDLPLHNKFSNWSGVQGNFSGKQSLARSSADLTVRESPTNTKESPARESRSREIESLQKERAEIMSSIHLEVNPQPLTVQLAEAKLSYGIGETDALLRVMQDGKFDGQDPVSIKKQLYDRHMKVIECLRKEREERLQSFRRSRSLSPQKQLALSQGSLTSLRDSDLPSRRREYLQQLRKDVVDNTRILDPKRASPCPSEIEFLLKDYQKAREEAKSEIARARDKLRERAEQEKKRLQSQPRDDNKLKTHTSTSTLFTSSSLSLSSGPTSGYNSSITATYGKSCKLGNFQETKTPPRIADTPSMTTRGRSAGRNCNTLPSIQKPCTPVASVPVESSLDVGYFPYTSSPMPSLESYQEFSRLVQENATAEVMASCGGDLKNLFLSRSASGWRYQCMDRDVRVYYKAFPSSTKHGFLGAGVIKRPLLDVWCMVKDIGTRPLYDTTILSTKVHQRVKSGIQLVHVVCDVSLCYLKQPRDFCCISVESKEGEACSLCFQSLYDETLPRPSKDTVRGEILPSAWMLQEDSINGETVTRVVYMLQVDLGAPMIPTRLLPALTKRQPLVIASLAKVLSQ